MVDFVCLNCGKSNEINQAFGQKYERKFCDRKCYLEYMAKKKRAKEAVTKEKTRLRTRLTPEQQCRKCANGFDYGGRYGCGYVYTHDHSRLSLHPEGMPAECQEFTPKKRSRQGRGKYIK